jgi:hypothetical protein
MKSVADEARRETMRRVFGMSPAERVELAFRLGEEDLAAFQLANGLSRSEALAILRRNRQRGRTPCSFFEDAR